MIKVACVGDSITFGEGVEKRLVNSYPAKLQALLGNVYEVRNFGVCGATVSVDGDYPYVMTDAYKQSVLFEPDVVLLKLGTNDSKLHNHRFMDGFKEDYRRLINSYRSSKHEVRIVIVAPATCFLLESNDISEHRIRNYYVPFLKELANESGTEFVDGSLFFDGEWDETLVPDKIHPSALGADIIAHHILERVFKKFS
ncbi:MAG: GDSL-type esterase/lipase family protein [Marinifilaceae bacterium]